MPEEGGHGRPSASWLTLPHDNINESRGWQRGGGPAKRVPLSASYLLSRNCVERHYRSPVDTDKLALRLNSSSSSGLAAPQAVALTAPGYLPWDPPAPEVDSLLTTLSDRLLL